MAALDRGQRTAIVIPGNTGTIRHSQYLPSITGSAEWEQWGLTLHGRVLHQNPRVLNRSVDRGSWPAASSPPAASVTSFQWRKVGIG